MSPKDSRKVYHPELEIPIYLSNFSKEIRQITDQHTYKKNHNYLELVYQHPRNVSKEFQKDISPRTGYIFIFV